MVEKLTIFEPHFEGAQFGPGAIELPGDDVSNVLGGGTDETDTQRETDSPSEESKSKLTMFLQGALVFVVMFTTLWLLFSRVLSDNEESEE